MKHNTETNLQKYAVYFWKSYKDNLMEMGIMFTANKYISYFVCFTLEHLKGGRETALPKARQFLS